MDMSSIQTAAARPLNSTIDHAISIPIPSFIRLPYRFISHFSPDLGGELARRIFFHPPRPFHTDRQRQMLDRAEAQDLGCSSGRLATYSWGKGPAVLLIHGWGGHAGQMTEFAAPLTDAGFRAIAIDLPAHGRSAGKLSSLVHFSEAIHVAAHAFAPVHGVITHSLGGAALIWALRQDFTARRTVLISPQAQLNDYWRAFRSSLRMSDASWAAMVAKSERWLGVSFPELHPRVGAPRMTAPALILHGEDDRLSPVNEGRELARLWPGARIEEFAGTGHLSILRHEQAIRAASLFMQS